MSATAGTIFHATRTPLTVWFAAAWMMVTQKHGISALGLRTYRSLVANAGTSIRPPPAPPPADKRIRPPSLAGEPLDRPWRS